MHLVVAADAAAHAAPALAALLAFELGELVFGVRGTHQSHGSRGEIAHQMDVWTGGRGRGASSRAGPSGDGAGARLGGAGCGACPTLARCLGGCLAGALGGRRSTGVAGWCGLRDSTANGLTDTNHDRGRTLGGAGRLLREKGLVPDVFICADDVVDPHLLLASCVSVAPELGRVTKIAWAMEMVRLAGVIGLGNVVVVVVHLDV